MNSVDSGALRGSEEGSPARQRHDRRELCLPRLVLQAPESVPEISEASVGRQWRGQILQTRRRTDRGQRAAVEAGEESPGADSSLPVPEGPPPVWLLASALLFLGHYLLRPSQAASFHETAEQGRQGHAFPRAPSTQQSVLQSSHGCIAIKEKDALPS